MIKKLLLLACLVFLPRAALATSASCAHGVMNLTADVVLTGSETFDAVGTATQRCTVLGNGHSVLIANNDTLHGHWKCDHADVFDLVYVLGPGAGGNFAVFDGTFDSQDCTFRRSFGFRMYATGGGTYVFKRNVWASDFSTDCGYVSSASTGHQGFLHANGSSTGTGVVQGNQIWGCWMDFDGALQWTVGSAAGCTTTCDADANLMTGARVGIGMPGYAGPNHLGHNFIDHLEDVSPDVPFWADVESLYHLSNVTTAENVVNVGGQWSLSFLDGTVKNSVFANAGGHDAIRIGAGGSAFQNIFSGATGMGDGQRYGLAYCTNCIGEEGNIQLPQSGNTLSFYNNTQDLLGRVSASCLQVGSGATATTYRDNICYGIYLKNTTCPAGSVCSSALRPEESAGAGSIPARLGYADYNLFRFDPLSARKVVYDLKVSGHTVCDSGNGLHDIGTCNGQGSDPVFKGPLPISTPYDLSGNRGAAFPFNPFDVMAGRYTVSDILSYYRWVYAPDSGSPALNAGSTGQHIGGVLAADIPGSTPAIVSAVKPPAAWAGLSYTTATCCTGMTTSDADLNGGGAAFGGTITTTWTLLNGPGAVTFDHADRQGTRVSMAGASGVYTFRFTVTDGTTTVHQDRFITKP